MRSLFSLCLLCLLGMGTLCQAAEPRYATLETSLGDIKIELYRQQSPKSVDAFTRYVKAGSYNNTLFHRVVDHFVIQAGLLYQEKGSDRTDDIRNMANIPNFPPEVRNGLKNKLATVSLLREGLQGTDVAPSGFFINLKDNPVLDYRRYDKASMVPTLSGQQEAPAGTETAAFAVFGRVVAGMEVAEKIAEVEVQSTADYEHMPVVPVLIKRIRLSER